MRGWWEGENSKKKVQKGQELSNTIKRGVLIMKVGVEWGYEVKKYQTF